MSDLCFNRIFHDLRLYHSTNQKFDLRYHTLLSYLKLETYYSDVILLMYLKIILCGFLGIRLMRHYDLIFHNMSNILLNKKYMKRDKVIFHKERREKKKKTNCPIIVSDFCYKNVQCPSIATGHRLIGIQTQKMNFLILKSFEIEHYIIFLHSV